jgi:hypothetical protein
MDDFVILAKEKNELWDILKEVKDFLSASLKLELNPKRIGVIPIEKGIDFLGYVIFLDGYKRIRQRNVISFRKRLKRLSIDYSKGRVLYNHARSSIASWLGLAKHANAFKLSSKIFLEHDIHNIGKRLMLKMAYAGRVV